MHSTRTLRLLPLVATGLLPLAPSAEAQERVQLQQQPQTVQLQPLPVTQGPAPTVVIQQQYPQQYPQPMYQQPQYGPAPGPTYYVQAPPLPVGPAAPPLGPRVLSNWDDTQPVPPGYHVEEHVRKGLVIGGAVMFGTMYLLTALGASVASDTSNNNVTALWVPAVGPFIQMGQAGSATGGFFLALDGLVQVGGLAMFTIGLVAPRTEAVRNDLGLLQDLKVAPILGADHTGMGLTGRF